MLVNIFMAPGTVCLRPEFIDVNIDNFCIDENLLKKNSSVKAIMNIHILGNSPIYKRFRILQNLTICF